MLKVSNAAKVYFDETVNALVATGLQKDDAKKTIETRVIEIESSEMSTAWHQAWSEKRETEHCLVWACNEQREKLGIERKSPLMVKGLEH
jgi:hypothetical protein